MNTKTQWKEDFRERRESVHGGSAKTSLFSTVTEISFPLSLRNDEVPAVVRNLNQISGTEK